MTDPMQALESFEGLDGVADWTSKQWRALLNDRRPLKDLISGTPLGHALHPVLSDVPIGTWTSALILDTLGGEDSEDAADLLVLTGLLAAGPTALSGWSDWADSAPASKPVSRVGLVHGLTNATAIGLFGASLVARRAGDRGRGKLLGLAAGGVLTLGGYLGGHLSYAQGVGVDNTAFEGRPDNWAEAVQSGELEEGRPTKATVEGVDVMLVRQGGQVYALADTCTHRGGSLSEGKLVDGCIQCPLHASRFRLADGSVAQGPATTAEPTYEVRESEGRIEVRALR